MAAKKGRVYLLDQESTNLDPFRKAGFREAVVKPGLLYELVPPGREPHWVGLARPKHVSLSASQHFSQRAG